MNPRIQKHCVWPTVLNHREVFTNALSTKEKKGGKKKRKYDILNLLSQKRAKIESDSNLDWASADIYTGDVWTRARCSEASLHHADGTIHTADSWLLIKGRPSTANSRSETSGQSDRPPWDHFSASITRDKSQSSRFSLFSLFGLLETS